VPSASRDGGSVPEAVLSPCEPPGFDLRTCATETLTNFTCIVDELKNQGCRHLYVVTAAHHMARAQTVARIVLGRHRMAASPLPVADSRVSTESLARTLRDALRAILWSITGLTGPQKTIPRSRVAPEP
jgi:uncharacterized SAM-binding protein YcdF (DUF218 family)